MMLTGFLLSSAFVSAGCVPQQTPSGQIALEPCRVEGVDRELRCGVYEVFENRRTRQGRKIPLKIIVIPAENPHPERGPIFHLVGGPGETATELVDFTIAQGDAKEQDVVLVDERGTGDGHRLDCPSPGSDDNLQGYLEKPFDPAAVIACSEELQKKFDLTQYSTAAFVEDLEEVRRGLGYGKINLIGGSFGTYAALMYIKRYGENVRAAYLNSVVTHANRVPLYHAQGAQQALEQLFRECAEDPGCRSAYQNVAQDFKTLLARVREDAVTATVRHPVTGEPQQIQLGERAFADAVRVMLYRSPTARELPYLIRLGLAGNFDAFAETALRANRGVYGGVRIGLNLAITCSEFVSRIRPEEVEPAIRGTFVGPWRVQDQMAVCREWPKTELPPDLFAPFRSDVPMLLISGETDPARPSHWAEQLKPSLPKAVHVIVPGGAHTPANECLQLLRSRLFQKGTTQDLDLSCVKQMKRPGFRLP